MDLYNQYKRISGVRGRDARDAVPESDCGMPLLPDGEGALVLFHRRGWTD